MNDTVRLLRECDSGTKMAVSSIDDVLGRTESAGLSDLLTTSRRSHEKLGNKIHSLLDDYDTDDKEPAAMAKGMSWIKTNVKMTLNESDATIADLITDGCNMGVKSLCRYLNQFERADSVSKDICRDIIEIEDKLAYDLRSYL